jgi:hypothetical protein
VLAADHTDDVMRGGVVLATVAAAVSTDRRDLSMSLGIAVLGAEAAVEADDDEP